MINFERKSVLLVQVDHLFTANSAKIAAAGVNVVQDENVVPGRLNGWLERDARHFAGDVLHRFQDDRLIGVGEGAVESIFYHTSRPKKVRVGKRGAEACLVSRGLVTDDNVAFDR